MSTISIRDLLLKIISTRSGAVSHLEIKGVIDANYSRVDGGAVGSSLIKGALGALVKEGVLSVKTVNLTGKAGRTGYYTLIKNTDIRELRQCKVELKENLSAASLALNRIKPTHSVRKPNPLHSLPTTKQLRGVGA